MFRRGFVEAAQVVCSYDSRLDRILARLPLARSVANHLVDRDDYDFAKLVANPRCSELAALRVGAGSATAGDRAIEQLVDHGVVLRALHVANCSRAGARLLQQSGVLDRVERLALGAVEDGARIISAVPRLRALYLRDALDSYASAIPRTVVELGCRVSGIDAVASLAIAPTLERLRVDALELAWDFETLAVFRSLRSLDLFHSKPGSRYRPFALERPGVLPSLRELSLGMWLDEPSVEPIARAFGPQLDTLHWSGLVPLGADPAVLRAPLVAGDARIGAHVDGEFVVGLAVPWARRPLQFGDDGRAPWFEGGGVAIRS